MLFTSCAQHTPAPVATRSTETNADPGMILVGTVVTMNAHGVVLKEGRVWVRSGRIEGVFSAAETLPALASNARLVETGGVIYPGLIDIHNHPEYAVYPLLPVTRKYKDRYEWRHYDDDYQKRISNPNTLLGNVEYYNLGMEVGRYGEYMALAGGTTTLQGGGTGFQQGVGSVGVRRRFFRPYAREACLTRNVETASLERNVNSYVDMGRDAADWGLIQKDFQNGPLILHLAEGTSSRMADEFRAIRNSGLVGENLVVIHGVGLNADHFAEMAKVGAKLVWSPLSNFLLYGKTADVVAAEKAGLTISLAPDWAASGSKSVLGELKVAALVNENALGGVFSDRDLVAMATINPARSLGWSRQLGQIQAGYLADLLVVDAVNNDPYRNLIEAHEAHVKLTMVRGEALYGDEVLVRGIRGVKSDTESAATFTGNRVKVIAPNCKGSELPDMSLSTTKARLQQALAFDATYTAQTVQPAQIAKDLARCNLPAANPASPKDDASTVLRCRFGLPFEATRLPALTTPEDAEYLRRVVANPNIPAYLKRLPEKFQ